MTCNYTCLAINHKKNFSAVAFFPARVSASSRPQTELAFVLGKAPVAPMNVMTVAKLEIQAALLAARLKQDIWQALKVKINGVFMWTGRITVLQWLNFTTKHPIFIANRVCEILEHTSVDEWNNVASNDNTSDSSTRGISAKVLQSSKWERGPDFLRSTQSPFKPSTELFNSIKLGIVTNQFADNNASATNSTNEPPSQIISLDKFSSY